MTVKEFIQKYKDKTLGFPEGRYVGECLSLVKVYIQQKYGFYPPASGSNSAHGYWYNFPNPLPTYFFKIENTKDFVPETGDIMIWSEATGNGYGHISIVINNDEYPADTRYFWSFDQNWGGRSAHMVRHNYNNVLGVLRPKGDSYMANMYKGLDLNNTESMKPAVDVWYEVMIEKLWVKLQDLDVLLHKLGAENVESAVAEVENRLEQVSRLKQELLNSTQLRNELMEQHKDLEGVIKVYENELVELKTTIDEQAEKIGEQARLIAELKKQADEGTVVLPEEPKVNYIQLFFKWLYERLANRE